MRRWLAGGSTVLVLLMALPAVAQDAEIPDVARPGFYGGVDALYAVELFGGNVSGSPVTGENSWGWGFRAGYRASRFLAVEGQFEAPDGFEVKVGGTAVGKIDPLIFSVNVKGFFPLGDFQPYLLFGGGFFQPGLQDLTLPAFGVNVDSLGIVKAGAGLDYFLTDNLSIGTSVVYNHPFSSSSEPDFSYLGIGASLQYTFRFADGKDW